MRVRVQKYRKVAVLDLHGRLTVADDATRLHEIVRQLTRLEVGSIVLNLENVSRLDCSGVGQLVQLHCAVRQAGASLVLANVDAHQKQLLEIMQLLAVIPVRDTLGEALQDGGSSEHRAPAALPANTERRIAVAEDPKPVLHPESLARNCAEAKRYPSRLCCLLLLVVSFAACGTAHADDVYLRNGRVIHNVTTREQDGLLVVMQDGTMLAFPMALVERVEEKEIVETVARPVRRPNRAPAATPAGASPHLEGPNGRTPASFKYGEVMPKTVRINNGLDVVTFTLPAGTWTWAGDTSRERATGQDDDPFGHMNPSNLMAGLDGGALYSLTFWPIAFHPDLEMTKDELAQTWLSRARTELREGPMQTRSAAREARRRVGAGRYFTTTYHHLWKDSDYLQDGIFLLCFPRDFKKEHRFYVLQWFVTYGPELGRLDLDLTDFDTIVRTFRTRPVR